MTFGKVIKFYREKAKISRKEFAIRCNMSTDKIGRIERGQQVPHIPDAYILIRILNAQLYGSYAKHEVPK